MDLFDYMKEQTLENNLRWRPVCAPGHWKRWPDRNILSERISCFTAPLRRISWVALFLRPAGNRKDHSGKGDCQHYQRPVSSD